MTDSMDIRALQKHDLDQLLALYEHLNPADRALPPRPQVDAIWDELLASPRYRYFGGFIGDQLLCSCTLTVIPNLTRGCAPYGLIENVVTHVDHRNKGHGKALLARAVDAAWSDGCYKVMLMTSRKDPAVHAFYRSAGFDGGDKTAYVMRARN
ncbi:MAG TPA: GNAT family N-acetyltransferase [Pseudomonadales bacterium]